jgi:hypothetical protein
MWRFSEPEHGGRLGSRREKTEFLLAELVAECLDVVARLGKLAIACFPTLITAERGRRYGQSLEKAADSLPRNAQMTSQHSCADASSKSTGGTIASPKLSPIACSKSVRQVS